MNNDFYEKYRLMLQLKEQSQKLEDIDFASKSLDDLMTQSVSFQNDSMVNGFSQPLIATRISINKCSISVPPNGEVNIGDLVYVFNEYWICISIYTDEIGCRCGELWMCNQIFKTQDENRKTVITYAIIDGGSYSNNPDKQIKTTNNTFDCYVSLNNETKRWFVDKRLCIDVVYNKDGNQCLDVAKISWIDSKSKNYGANSHLLYFGLTDDVYNKETDNLEKMICDYTDLQGVSDDVLPLTFGQIVITGRDELRIGTERTFKASAINNNGTAEEITSEVVWSLNKDIQGVTLSQNGNECVVSIKLDADLIGEEFELECLDASQNYSKGKKRVVVISIG